MLKKSLLLAVFSGLALFSVSVLSENVAIDVTPDRVYHHQIALLDSVKIETERFFEAPAAASKQKSQLQDNDNELVSKATGLALLTFGLIAFVLRSSRERI